VNFRAYGAESAFKASIRKNGPSPRGSDLKRVVAGWGQLRSWGWEPFASTCRGLSSRDATAQLEDHAMLELTGEIAMQSDDLEAIEAWIEQAKALKHYE